MENEARGSKVSPAKGKGEEKDPAKGKGEEKDPAKGNKGEEKEPETSRWPTPEERWAAALEHLTAMHADVNRFMEETLREIEEDKKAGRVEDPAEIDMDLWKKSYAKIIRDYPPPEFLVPAATAAMYLKYLEDQNRLRR